MANYVKIKINSNKKNKEKGFFLLLTNGNTYSEKKDEFIVESKCLDILEQNKIGFKVIPS